MKIKKIVAQRKLGIGLLVGLCLFLWVSNTFAEPEEDEGSIEIKIAEKKGRNKPDRGNPRENSSDESNDESSDESSESSSDESDDSLLTSENIIAVHQRSSPQYDKDCTDCHRNIPAEQSFNPSIRSAHVAMLPQTPGEDTDIKCTWCHKTVDLTQKSSGNIRRHVDVTLCTFCHGSFGVEKQYYQTGLSPDNPDGPVLYNLVCASCHNGLTNSEVKNESASDIQEEIDDNEGGMGPLRFLSSGEIRAIADALANPGEDD
jgi:hypothetical protein